MTRTVTSRGRSQRFGASLQLSRALSKWIRSEEIPELTVSRINQAKRKQLAGALTPPVWSSTSDV